MDGQMNIFDFIKEPEPMPDPRPDACVREYLRYGAHTLIPEVADRVKKYLDTYGVPAYIRWDKESLPCSNCEHYDGLQCVGGGGRYHYEYGYRICDLFHQSITQRTPSTAKPFTPAEEHFKRTGSVDYTSQLIELPESEAEMAKLIGKATNLVFQYDSWLERWKAKKKGLTYKVHYGVYAPNLDGGRGGKKHVSLNVTYPSKGGYGVPCDTIEEAIDYIKRTMKAQEEGKIMFHK